MERLDKESGRWAKATPDPILSFNTRVKGLFEGKKYAFRVTAENSAGFGVMSEPSQMISICRPMSKHFYVNISDKAN